MLDTEGLDSTCWATVAVPNGQGSSGQPRALEQDRLRMDGHCLLHRDARSHNTAGGMVHVITHLPPSKACTHTLGKPAPPQVLPRAALSPFPPTQGCFWGTIISKHMKCVLPQKWQQATMARCFVCLKRGFLSISSSLAVTAGLSSCLPQTTASRSQASWWTLPFESILEHNNRHLQRENYFHLNLG